MRLSKKQLNYLHRRLCGFACSNGFLLYPSLAFENGAVLSSLVLNIAATLLAANTKFVLKLSKIEGKIIENINLVFHKFASKVAYFLNYNFNSNSPY